MQKSLLLGMSSSWPDPYKNTSLSGYMIIYSIFNILVQRDKYLKGERKILLVDIQLDVTCHCTFCRPLAHKRTPFLGQFYCLQPSLQGCTGYYILTIGESVLIL